MQIEQAELLVKEADRLLTHATRELQRSEEDVTSTLVCYNARQSIINYLCSYLLKNNVDIKEPVTLSGLIEQCNEIDARFGLIDISDFGCKHDETDEAYCLHVDKVSSCYEVAKQAQGLVKSNTPPY
ncbi:MAG: hypothetical protein KJP00_06985 [Bacteroidia bacterium]|nr:hypothetical protein [Bacteroidia bacterium]